jgi:hypothetical protein
MALTYLLRGEENKKFKDTILEHIPGSEHFQALSKRLAVKCKCILPCEHEWNDDVSSVFTIVAQALIATKLGMWEQFARALLPASRNEISLKLKTMFSENRVCCEVCVKSELEVIENSK